MMDSNDVSVLHRPGNTVVATIPVGNIPHGVAITPDGTQAYVANNGDGTVSVIATATNTVAGLPNPFAVAITPDGTQAYVTNGYTTNTVSVIKTANRAVVATIPVGNFPIGVAITPDGTHAYVTNCSLRQCFGDRHGHQHGGGHGHGGRPKWGSRQPERARRLRREK